MSNLHLTALLDKAYYFMFIVYEKYHPLLSPNQLNVVTEDNTEIHSREITPKGYKVEQPYLCATHHLVLIYMPTKYNQNKHQTDWCIP